MLLVPRATVHLAQFEATGRRHMYHVRTRPGLRTEFVNDNRRQILNQRRMGSQIGIPAGVAGLAQAPQILPGQLLHLVMDTAGETRWCNHAKSVREIVLFNAGEPPWRRFECRELECAGAGARSAPEWQQCHPPR